MKKPFAYAVSSLALVALALTVRSQTAGAGPEGPYRLTVVKTDHAPHIDGDMNQTDWIGPEWGRAAAVTGFTDIATRRYSPRQARAYFTYDAEKLYFAFSSDIEPGTHPVANTAARDGSVWADDAIEFLIAPPGEDQKEKPAAFQFIGNSAGVFFDSKGGDKAWNGDWQYAAKVYAKYWIAEGSIRWADLGVAAPKDGEVWRINFCRDWQSPAASTVWGPSTNFLDVKSFPLVTFREKGTLARLDDLGKFTSGNVKFGVELANIGGAAPEDVEGTLTLGGVPLKAAARVEPNGRARLEFAAVAAGQETETLALHVQSKSSGNTLWQGALAFNKTDPVTVELQAMPGKDRLEIKIDAAGLPGRSPQTTAKIAFMADNGSRKVSEISTGPLDEAGRSFGHLPLSKLPVGDYVVLATLYEGDRRLNESRAHFNRIDESWIGNKVGISDKILPGWIPISVRSAAKTSTLKMWGRDVTFDGTLFPSQIVSRSAPLLASPIRLEGSVDGRPIRWDSVSFKITKQTPARVDFITTATSGKLQVENVAYLEYDGMFFFKMKLRPLAQNVKVDSLRLVVPFAAGRAIFFNKAPGDFQEDYGGHRIPAGEGSVLERPFANFMWVGDYDRGLQWFAEDDTAWNIPGNRKTLQLSRKNGSVDWGITFADAPLDLNAERTIAFGLHPTPVKPLPKGSRMMSMASHLGHSPGIIWTDPTSTKYFGYPEVPDLPYIKSRTENNHAHGVRVLPYMCPVRLAEGSPEWDYYGKEWEMPGVLNNYDVDVLAFPGGSMGVCPAVPAMRDWMSWKNEEYLRLTGFNGLYYDFGWPYPCFHAGHGHPVGAMPLLGYREVYRRLYTLIKERDPNDLVVAHISGGIFMPMLSWADATVPGEEIVTKMANVRAKPETKDTTDLADVIPLDYHAAFNMGRQFGNVPLYMQPVWAQPRHHNAYELLTDSISSWRYDAPTIQLYQELGMGEADVRFLPYWNNSKLVQVAFPEAPQGVKGEEYPQPMTSLYQRPGKFVMFAVTNLTKGPRRVRVTFDPKALGVDLKEYALTDAYSTFPVFTASPQFQVEVPARSYRLILLKKRGAGDKLQPQGVVIPAAQADMLVGRGFLRGDTGITLYAGDATRDEKAPLPQESRIAQSFTLKKTTKIQNIGIELLEPAGRYGNFCDLRIYEAGEDGAPTGKMVNPKAWTWYSSVPGYPDYKHFYFRESLTLPPGRYSMVLSKMPAKPEERHRFEVRLWPQAYMPEEGAWEWTNVTKRWQRADGVIGFGIYGFER